jgi:hypothetical protein
MLIALAASVGQTVQAERSDSKPSQAKPCPLPLAGLPSKPGPHVAKIRALGEDTWLHLGKPRPDPRWGTARGRSWGARMPYAPDLGGSFLYGEGVHGWWNEKTGRYMDDLWFYDSNAHRWICVYPGADVKHLDLRLDKNGFEVTRDGMPLPVAPLAHAYEMLTYNTDLKKFMFMPCDGGYWNVFKKRRTGWLKDRAKNKQVPSSPWLYDTKTGKWQLRATSGPAPRSGFGHVLIYVPGRKQAFFWGSGAEVWFYDYRTNKWTKVTPKGPPPPFGIDPTACLDPNRDRIYMGGGSYPVAKGANALWIYDLKTNTWMDPRPKGKPCKGSNSYATNYATMNYDAAADVVLLNRHGGDKEQRGVYLYHPDRNAWTSELKPYPRGLTWKCVNGFYDAGLNVHVFHSAGDSQDDGTIWVYRYKQAKK